MSAKKNKDKEKTTARCCSHCSLAASGETAGSDGCAVKHKHREEAEYQDLIHRLNRVEGQVRGVRAMVEDERYCVDILTQVSAIQSALNAFNKTLLAQHIKTCVAENIRNGNDEVVDELCEALQKLMK
jgi:DNA-binding FrmR family transcriptional regulator